MRQLILLIFLAWHAGVSFGQEMKRDTVKDGEVCYVVTTGKWGGMNVKQVGTSVGDRDPYKTFSGNVEEMTIRWQLWDIFRRHLTEVELKLLKDSPEDMLIYISYRINEAGDKISAVEFDFSWEIQKYWQDFLPKRLFEIEKDIKSNVVVPADMPVKYRGSVFVSALVANYLHDEKAMRELKTDMQDFKKDPLIYWEKRLKKMQEKKGTKLISEVDSIKK